MSAAPAPAPAVAAVEAAAAAPPKKRGRLVLLIVAVVVLGGLGAGAWLLLPKFLGTAQAKAAPAEPEVKATVALGAVVVNLNGEARRYLRVGVSLGVPAEADAKKIEEQKPQLLDLLISVFSAAEVETLTSEEGKTELKKELLSRMREELRLKKVARVYFTEFVLQ